MPVSHINKMGNFRACDNFLLRTCGVQQAFAREGENLVFIQIRGIGEIVHPVPLCQCHCFRAGAGIQAVFFPVGRFCPLASVFSDAFDDGIRKICVLPDEILQNLFHIPACRNGKGGSVQCSAVGSVEKCGQVAALNGNASGIRRIGVGAAVKSKNSHGIPDRRLPGRIRHANLEPDPPVQPDALVFAYVVTPVFGKEDQAAGTPDFRSGVHADAAGGTYPLKLVHRNQVLI